MKCEVKIIKENDEPLIITGDLDEHVMFRGKQKFNRNGVIILQWTQKYRLTMLNNGKNVRVVSGLGAERHKGVS